MSTKHPARGTGLIPELQNSRNPAPAARKPRADAGVRQRVLDAAIAAGKFPETRRAHYAAMYDKDPDATCRLIDRLAAAPEVTRDRPRGTGLIPELG